MDLTGKTAVVTGGSRGIGRAVCLELAKRGADIVLCYAGSAAAGEETAAGCRALGRKALAVACNVASASEAAGLIESAIQLTGHLDILVCNAGISRDGLLLSQKESDIDAVLDTNLKGTFLCMKAALRPMLRQRSGRICAVSSVVGMHGNAGQTAYAASKAGILGLVRSLAKETAARNITVNAVAPGYIQTDMTDALPDAVRESFLTQVPLKRAGRPEDVAKAITFLCSEDAAYITGQVLGVDGGMGM